MTIQRAQGTVKKLEEAFIWGLNDEKACLLTDIAITTPYDYCNKNPDFSEQKVQKLGDNKKERKTNMKIMEFKEKYNDLINEIDNRISYNNARGSLGYSVDGEVLQKLIDCLKDEYPNEEFESEE